MIPRGGRGVNLAAWRTSAPNHDRRHPSRARRPQQQKQLKPAAWLSLRCRSWKSDPEEGSLEHGAQGRFVLPSSPGM